MLIYVASYPRSGNSLIQSIVQRHFKWPITGWYLADKLQMSDFCSIQHSANARSTYFRALDKLLNLTGGDPNLKRWTVTYHREGILGRPPLRDQITLLPGCGHAMTEKNRKFLAELDTPIFVKTHELPLNKYFSGEYVITITRHPGPVLRSYYKLLKRQHRSIKLEAVIQGNVRYGSWSRFEDCWEATLNQLGDCAVAVRFEDMTADPLPGCERISKMIGQPFETDAQTVDFKELKKKSPGYYSSGIVDANPQHYEPQEWDLLMKAHGQTMLRLGYLDAASPSLG